MNIEMDLELELETETEQGQWVYTPMGSYKTEPVTTVCAIYLMGVDIYNALKKHDEEYGTNYIQTIQNKVE